MTDTSPRSAPVPSSSGATPADEALRALTADERFDHWIEDAIVRALFGGNQLARRAFLGAVGSGTFYAALEE